MKSVLLVGSILTERQYLVDRIASADQVAYASQTNIITSSKVINAGRILAINHQVKMYGTIGADTDGTKALADLICYHIDPNLIVTKPKATTGQVLTITDREGKTAITLYLGASSLTGTISPKVVKQFDCMYLETSLPLKSLYQLISTASKVKTPVLLDFPNQQREFNKIFLRTIDFLMPNRQEAELLLNTKINTVADAQQAAVTLKKFTRGTVIISIDKDGCIVLDSKANPLHIPSKKVTIHDTTACGDIFRGVFLSEFLNSRNLNLSAQKATQLATESIRHLGVDNSINEISKNYKLLLQSNETATSN